MKISENNSFVNLDVYARQVEGDKKENVGNNTTIAEGRLKDDEVTFSSIAKKLSDVRRTLDSLPDIREEKTAYIKSQLETKSYGLDEKKIALSMLRESLFNEMV
jgi:flagellar biosynthesis anti-sigma factor FlgM